MISNRGGRSAAAESFRLRGWMWCVAFVAVLLTSSPLLAQSSDNNKKQHSFAQNSLRLQAHLRQLLDNPEIRVAQKDDLAADLLIGDKRIGIVEQDEDDEDFLTVTVEIPENEALQNRKPDAAKAEAYLRALLGSSRVRVVADKEGDVEVFADQEALGNLFFEPDSPAMLMMLVAEDELPVTAEMMLADIEPVDAANSTYYARTSRVPVRESPSDDAPAVTHLAEDQQVKVIGKARNSRQAEERWYQVEFADGKPRYVLGKDLLSEKSAQDKTRYRRLSSGYPRFLEQIGNSQGTLAKYMGFYTLGPDCVLRPFQTERVKGFDGAHSLAQRVQDLHWSTSSWALWTDGTFVFRARVEDGEVARFKPTPIRTIKTQNLGEVRFYRFDRLEPPGLDADLAVAGFTEQGKILISVELNGNKFKYMQATPL